MSTDAELDVLDLDASRETRAAAREGRGTELPIRLGGKIITTLPAEFPLDVLSPLREIDEDLALLLNSVMRAAGGSEQSKWDATNLVIDLLVQNPRLPTTVLDTVTRIGQNLLGEEGYAEFTRARPSREDVAALAKGLFSWYGVTLGEASVPSASSTDGGGTSNTTSSPNSTDSTPEVSGSAPESQAS